MNKRILLILSVVFLSFSVSAESLRKNSKTVLCQKLVFKVFRYSGSDAKLLQKKCMKSIQANVTKKLTQKVGEAEFLTGLDADFKFSFKHKNENGNVSGKARLLYEYETKDSGKMVGKWKIAESKFVVDNKKVGFETIKAEYEDAVYEEDLHDAIKKGIVRKATAKEYNEVMKEIDVWDAFKDFSSPEEMPDYEIRNYEETLYVFVKGGVLLPFALEASWEEASTEWDELDFSENDALWFADPDEVLK